VLAPLDIPVAGPITGDVVDSIIRVLGQPLWDQLEHDSSFIRTLQQTSTAGMAEFNKQVPNVPGVRYASIAGRTALSDGGSTCRADGSPAFIAQSSRELDTTDLALILPELATAGLPLADEPNDGFIRVSEAKWGTFLGCIPADHFDEIGQLTGDKPGLGNDWDYLAFYRGLVADLRAAGL
jgi:triacylglycerol lipase